MIMGKQAYAKCFNFSNMVRPTALCGVDGQTILYGIDCTTILCEVEGPTVLYDVEV